MSKNQTSSKLKPDQSEGGACEMRKTVETKEDGRKLIYYNFVRTSETSSADDSGNSSGKEGGKS